MYTDLLVLKKAITDGELKIPYSMFNSLPIHNYLYDMPFPERFEAFELIFEEQKKEENETLNYYENILKMNGISKDLENSTKVLAERYKNNIKKIEERVAILNTLIEKFNKNEQYDFDLKQYYEITDWKENHIGDTGMGGVVDMESKTVKVLTNSVFQNAYNEFILGIKDNILSKDTTKVPYIGVYPISGEYENVHFYIPLTKILTH